jgi:UDP-glucose 4-epimerase
MSTVLVTGGAGFIGSHLVDKLIEQNHTVLVVDDMSSGCLQNVNPEARFFDGFDVAADDFMNTGLKFEVIYHLAAVSRIPLSKNDPLRAYKTNSLGTYRMLEMAHLMGSRFVYAGTSCEYWDHHSNPYAYTKHLGEEHCGFFAKYHGLSTVIARFFNVYGPRCPRSGPSSTVVGIFEDQRKRESPLTITGDGNQRRDFIHVSDIVAGLLKLGERPYQGAAYDFGCGHSYSINQVASMFQSQSGVSYIDRPSGEAEETKANLEETTYFLGWEPQIHLQDYIEEYLRTL